MGYRKTINRLSYLLMLISLYFIFDRLLKNYSQLTSWVPDKSDYLIIIICIIVYAFNNFLLSGAWKYLLLLSGYKNISFSRCHIIYGRTQIAKYVPGNIFHLVGRYFLGKSEGIPRTALLTSSIYENIGLFLVASAFTIICYILNGVHDVRGITLYRILFISGFAFVLGYIVYYFINKKSPGLDARDLKSNLFGAGVCYTGFFAIFATVAIAAFFLVVPDALTGNVYYVFLVFISSWIIGYVTLGAPAGVGVREAVIILLLGSLSGEGESLIIAFLFRLITVAGDFVFFLSSYIVEAYKNKANVINHTT